MASSWSPFFARRCPSGAASAMLPPCWPKTANLWRWGELRTWRGQSTIVPSSVIHQCLSLILGHDCVCRSSQWRSCKGAHPNRWLAHPTPQLGPHDWLVQHPSNECFTVGLVIHIGGRGKHLVCVWSFVTYLNLCSWTRCKISWCNHLGQASSHLWLRVSFATGNFVV